MRRKKGNGVRAKITHSELRKRQRATMQRVTEINAALSPAEIGVVIGFFGSVLAYARYLQGRSRRCIAAKSVVRQHSVCGAKIINTTLGEDGKLVDVCARGHAITSDVVQGMKARKHR